MTTPREAAKQCIINCIAHKEPLRIGVHGSYDGYHVQIGGQVGCGGQARTYDRHLVICERSKALYFFSLYVLLYEINVAQQPAMTPREAAKALVTRTVQRGIARGHSISKITSDLQDAQLGHCWVDYWAQIGSGYRGQKSGKQRATRPGDLIVRDINRIACNEIFDLREIVAELHAEFTCNPCQVEVSLALEAQATAQTK